MTLRQAVCTAAPGSSGGAGFFARLRAGVLVRERFSTVTPVR